MDDLALHHSVSQFLYREAGFLDERCYAPWLELWADDASYVIPTTWNSSHGGLREAASNEIHHLRAGKDMLRLRVAKLDSRSAWAEEPPSRTVRTVSNIEVRRDHDSLHVRSNVVLHRVRYTDEVEVHAGSRTDRLVPTDEAWQIAERRVHLAHGVLRAENLEFFL